MKEHWTNNECGIIILLSMISKKWMLLIMKNIYEWANSYSEVEKNVVGITPSTLSARLKELQEIWFIEKNIISQTPIKVEYKLTQKWQSFSEHIKNMCDWSKEWM
jgi:DNA-binding HxlR family transcriptional regulator